MKLIKSNSSLKEYCLDSFLINKTKKEKPDISKEFFDLSNIESGEYFKKNTKTVPSEIKSDLIIVQKGDLVYGKCRPNLDKAILADNEGLTTTEALVYSSNCSGFALAVLHSKDFINYNMNNSTGSKMPRTSNKNVLNYKFNAPININFERTGNYLLSFANHIENIKDLIKKIETRNQYYAEKILSGELRVRKNENGNIEFYNNTEWQEDNLKSLFFSKEYSIPKGWKIKPILDNVKLVKGISINSSEFNYQGTGFQFLRTGDVWEDASSKKEPAFFDGMVDDKFIKTENDYVSCFEGFNKEIGNGTIGLVTNLGHGIVSSHLYKTENKNIDGKYYSVALLKTDYIQNILIRNAVGSTVLSSTKCLKDILFIFPDNDEMILIEEVLSSLYLESNNLRKVLEKENLRFQWLLDNLLSGEYQVVDE